MALTNSSALYDNYVECVKKVTAEDVKAAANKYLGVNRSAVSIVLPENCKEVKVSKGDKMSFKDLFSNI